MLKLEERIRILKDIWRKETTLASRNQILTYQISRLLVQCFIRNLFRVWSHRVIDHVIALYSKESLVLAWECRLDEFFVYLWWHKGVEDLILIIKHNCVI
jgi:hypothetical protein